MLLPNTFLREASELGLKPLRLTFPVGRYWAGLIHRQSMLRVPAFSAFQELLIEEVRVQKGDWAPQHG
jgi:hypothetical protein